MSSEISAREADWFWIANSNPTREFYAFKARFLKRFAYQDGWDLQTVERECWTCEGSGKHWTGNDCWKCDGTGTYTTREIFLQRWILNGRTFHVPEFCSPPHWQREGNIHNEIEGLIKHAGIDPKVSRRCFHRLLLRHEPMTFYNMVMQEVKDKLGRHQMKMKFCLIRLRNKMDLFPATPTDDVPF